MVKVSVIIATYNTGKYIVECLDSVINQTLFPIEIIIVDDGSTDNTDEILKRYESCYEFIKVIRQSNAGQGVSINRAMKCVKGEYIAFMDPDDKYPRNDCLEKLYETAVGNEALMCGGNILLNDNGRIINGYSAGDGDSLCSKNKYIDVDNYHYIYGHTRYLYSTKMMWDNEVKHGEYSRYGDQVLTLKALSSAGKVYELDYPVYEYRINHISKIYSEKVWLDVMKAFRDTLKMMITRNMKTMYEHNAYSEYSKLIKVVFQWIETNDEWKAIIKEIEDILDGCAWRSVNSEVITDYKKIKGEIRKLIQILDSGRVLLYGAGNNTRRLLETYNRYRESIESIVVTHLEGDCKLEREVKSINEFISRNEEVQVIVTPSGIAGEEMYNNARSLGFKNVYRIDIECVVN